MLEIKKYKDGIAFLKNGFEFAFYSYFSDTLRFSSEIHNMIGYDWNTITMIYEVVNIFRKEE